MDIFIKDGKIVEIKTDGFLYGEYSELKMIDASGKIVIPGLIDMHVHFREPGYEYKETIETGCRSAAVGGFTAVCCMPNTNPVNDCKAGYGIYIKKPGRRIRFGFIRLLQSARACKETTFVNMEI